MLGIDEALSRLGISKSKLYALAKTEPLLRPVSVGGRSVRWPSDRVDAYIQRLIDQADAQGSLQ